MLVLVSSSSVKVAGHTRTLLGFTTMRPLMSVGHSASTL